MHGRSKLLVALLVAALTALTMSATAGAAAYATDMRVQVWDNTHRSMTADFCPGGHVNINYQSGITHDPCNRITYTHHYAHYGAHNEFDGVNPLGIIDKSGGRTWYCYARNPAIGKPFFICNGHKVELVEGEILTRHIDGATIRFHRGGDTPTGLHTEGRKNMLLEFTSLPA
jgi:hypothetical protein